MPPAARPQPTAAKLSGHLGVVPPIGSTIPESCTPAYQPLASTSAGNATSSTSKSATRKGGRVGAADANILEDWITYDSDAKTKLLHELLGLRPRPVIEDFAEHCRNEIYGTTSGVENWVNSVTSRRATEHPLTEDELNEMEQGPNQLNTLLESHMDVALDKWVAWCLRNTFNVPDGLGLVMPWHANLDFDRARFVAGSPGGEDAVQASIDRLRCQVEEMRKLKNELTSARDKVDKRVKDLELESAAIGFVADLAGQAGLMPLVDTSRHLASVTEALSIKLGAFGTTIPAPQPPVAPGALNGLNGSGPKEWEFGRAAYLSWASKRTLSQVASGERGAPGNPLEIEQRSQPSDIARLADVFASGQP